MQRKPLSKSLVLIVCLTLFAGYVALPDHIGSWSKPVVDFYFLGAHIKLDKQLKQGLDIQGGMQVALGLDMADIAAVDQEVAAESAREIIARRIDLYGVGEAVIQTAKKDDQHRLLVELPGVFAADEALNLLGQTAFLEFKLQQQMTEEEFAVATTSPQLWLNSFVSTGLTGADLKRAQVQLDPQTSQPMVALEMNEQGRETFATLTKEHVNEVLAIFVDGIPLVNPVISTPILDGRAVISGGFTIDQAKNLAIQLNAGALPVGIEVLEQRSIGASLGEDSIQKSVVAGVVGLGLVMLFMIFYYGWLGLIASLSLLIYATLTIAAYKLIGVVLTVPGIAGMILTIGMAVDANILVFERMKEEQRAGHSLTRALELGFGRAWDSIKDANLASIFTALVLINPLNFSFLNTSGLVKGFGLTLLIGIVLSLFTGVFISRVLLRMVASFLQHEAKGEQS